MVHALKPSLGKLPVGYHFHLASVCSVCIGAAENDKTLSAGVRAALRSHYGDEGIALLRRALELVPAADRPARRAAIRQDDAMAALRQRADCRRLLEEPRAEKPVTPAVSGAHPGNK